MGYGARHVFFYENGHQNANSGGQVSGNAGKDDDVLKPFRDWFDTLSNADQICWAFGIRPSQYDHLAGTEIWYDVTYQLRVRLGETTINHLQQHFTMVKILAQAFGGSDKKDVVKINDMAPQKAVSTLNSFFGGISK